MALRPQLLDEIAHIVTPSFTAQVARVFVFDAWEGTPGFVSVYVGKEGKPHLLRREYIASFTRSRRPRREPHIIILESGEEWLCHKGGCGCGSPIKQVNTRRALSDYEKWFAGTLQPDVASSIPSEELVGG